MMPSCDIYQQNRQILAQLGVTLWANRSSSIISFTPKTKRANSPEASVHQPDTAAPTPAVANHRDPKPAASSAATPKNPRQIIDALLKSTSQPKADQPSAHQISTEASLGEPSDHPKSDAPPIEFHLQAIIYRDWLILVDIDALDTAGRGLWLSLNQAIESQAERTGALFLKKTLDYPMFPDHDSAKSISTANTTVQGFVFGCTRIAKPLRHMAILSSLPDFLMLDGLYQMTVHKNFQIQDMLLQSTLKKQLWQLLHSSADA